MKNICLLFSSPGTFDLVCVGSEYGWLLFLFETIYSFVFFHHEKQTRWGPPNSTPFLPPSNLLTFARQGSIVAIGSGQPRSEGSPGTTRPLPPPQKQSQPGCWRCYTRRADGWFFIFFSPPFALSMSVFPDSAACPPREPLRPGDSGHSGPGRAGGCPAGRRGKGRGGGGGR